MIDPIDAQILEILQKDGRITNAELATRVGLTPGPTLARVNKLEASGVITGYCAQVDHARVGLPVTAFVSIIMKTHGRESSEAFLNAIRNLDEVQECHHIAGDEDYLLKVVAASPQDYENFFLNKLANVPDVLRVKTTIVLSSPKCEVGIPIRKEALS